ncbi:hypothetical protein ZWY2020_047642 [Hordeum vulgare]|nr:hypothetical protein ZWY2020_047642 [Hordeum vulgare]
MCVSDPFHHRLLELLQGLGYNGDAPSRLSSHGAWRPANADRPLPLPGLAQRLDAFFSEKEALVRCEGLQEVPGLRELCRWWRSARLKRQSPTRANAEAHDRDPRLADFFQLVAGEDCGEAAQALPDPTSALALLGVG